MPVDQYVYFALSSQNTPTVEMAAVLGIDPDETKVRGSRTAAPEPVPALHRWKIVCREPGLRVDEQITRVLERLAPHTDRIAALARRLDGENGSPSAVLQIVRHFNDQPAKQDPSATGQTERPNQFGWHLDRDVLEFLQATGAVLDVDEYDMKPDYADNRPGS